MENSRTGRALSGGMWMLSGFGGRQALLLVLSVVLARILSPQDFAAIALTMAVVAVIEVLAEMGLSVALVQRPDLTPKMIDSAFVLTVLFFSSGALLLLLVSARVAAYYELPALSGLMKLTSLMVLFRGVASFYRSLLLRDMKYRLIAAMEFLGTIVYGIVAVLTAAIGQGPYSILWGHVGGALATMVVLVAWKPVVPHSLGTPRMMSDLLQFGAWVSLGRVLGTASGQFDRLLIGKILAEQTLGGYYLAHRLTTTLPNLVTGVVDQVMLPIYSDSKNDPQVIERGYWKGLRYSAILVVPMCLLVAAYARPVVWLLLAEKWLFIVPIVQILSIFGAVQGLGGGVFASAIYASGIPRLNALVNGFRIVALPLCVWIGSRWGVEGVAWGVVCFGVVGRLFNQWLLRRYLGYSFLVFFREIAWPLLANAGMMFVGLVSQYFIRLGNPLQVLILSCLFGAMTLLTYCVLCYFTMPQECAVVSRHLYDRIGARRKTVLYATHGHDCEA